MIVLIQTPRGRRVLASSACDRRCLTVRQPPSTAADDSDEDASWRDDDSGGAASQG